MQITTSANVPDATYFRRHDAQPSITEDGTIVALSGRGSYRTTWGSPSVSSSIVVNEADFAAILVGFHHKHGGGQFWRYYLLGANGHPRQVTWRQLSTERRHLVLQSLSRTPTWARRPGEL